MSWRSAVCAGGLLFGVACATDNAPESSASEAVPHANEPPLDLSGERTWPAEYAQDPLWVRAAAGDDIDQARLARRESASSLLTAVAVGGSLGRAALAALPYASDRRAVLGALCALLARANAASQGALLAALYDAVMDAPDTEDAVDPTADRRCIDVLRDVAARELRDERDRDRARVVLGRLQPGP
jgi:hypothetical protein